MPALDYKLNAAIAARELSSTGSPTGSTINAKTVLLILFVAIVPVLIATGVVSWLLCCYGRGRGCGRRNKKNKSQSSGTSQQIAPEMITSAEQNSGRSAPAQSAPSRSAPAHTRNDSMMSKDSSSSKQSSIKEKAPILPKGFV